MAFRKKLYGSMDELQADFKCVGPQLQRAETKSRPAGALLDALQTSLYAMPMINEKMISG
jgi:hypothetical protein